MVNNQQLEPIKDLEIFKQHPKLLLRLNLSIEQNSYYEAHQAYKAVTFRCVTSNHVDDSIELLYNGICYFTQNNQNYCAFDLSKSFIDSLKKSTIQTLNTNLIDKIRHIHELLRGSNEERNEFTVNVLKWSATLYLNLFKQQQLPSNQIITTNFLGHPDLHREFAITFWKEKDYVQSRYHFLHSFDADSCANMLIEFHLNRGYPLEADLFLAQTVFKYLCVKNKQTARDLFDLYTKRHPNIDKETAPYAQPLLNFIWFLFVAIKDSRLDVFKSLTETYKGCLSRDPSFKDYLDKIGQLYFNMKARKTEQNPFQNILRMLMPASQPNNNLQDGSSSSSTNNANNNSHISNNSHIHDDDDEEDDDQDDSDTSDVHGIDDSDLLD